MIVTPATDTAFGLAEGPFWDGRRERLLWVDIPAGDVLEGRLIGDRIEVTATHHVDDLVGAVTAAADGTLLVAAREHLVRIDPDGTRTRGPRVVPAESGRRCNDGKTDPAGRLLIGTLSLADSVTLDDSEHRETLSRLENHGGLTMLDDDLSLSNGLAWSTDGRILFSVDTLRRRVLARSYDPDTGSVGERRPHVHLDDGHPDGLATDAEDHLWVAVWGAGEVRRFAPDGTLVQRFPVPAPHTSSVGFAGPDLDVLVVTTARRDLTSVQLQQFPDSGRLFTARPGVRGAPVPFWSPAPFSTSF